MAGIPEDELKAGFRAAFGAEDGPSVLARLEHDGRSVRRVLLRDLAGDDSPVLKPRGGREGRYQVVGEIARGGVGVVLKGRDVDLGRDVAMKILRDEHATNPEVVQRFVEEAQIGGQLQHPGIVPVYEMGLNAEQRPYFTMKLVKGKTLAALLRERRDPSEGFRRNLAIFERVCDTMAYAHSRGVVHRDLKPANIIVGAYAEVQIVDWGFAKVLGREEPPRAEQTIIATVRSGGGSASLAGSVMGTPAYMPPEQALGQVAALDERSDVFSLGAILCEILTGKPPYDAGASHDLLTMAAQGDLDGARGRLGDRELAPLVLECLAPKQSGRPRDAGELARRIHDHLASVAERTKAAEVAAAEEQAHAAEARHARRLTLAIAVAVLLAVSVGGGLWLWGERQARARAERVATEVRPILDKATLLRGRRKWAEALAVAKSADELARTGGADEETLARSRRLIAAIEEERRDADAEREQARRDRELLARFDEVRLAHAAEFDNVATEAGYRAAFDAYAGSLAELVAKVRNRPKEFAVRIASNLDAWARTCRYAGMPRSTWAPLVEAARSLDDHVWRNELRAAVLDGDPARMLAVAKAVPLGDPRSLHLASHLVLDHGKESDATPLLWKAWHLAPGSLWINYAMAVSLRDDPRASLPFLQAAVALRPESVPLRLVLAQRLIQVGELRTALAIYERHRDAMARVARFWAALAGLKHKLGDDRGAVEAMRRAVRVPVDTQRPGSLNGLAWALVLDPRLPWHDPETGLALARRAVEKRDSFAMWNTLATAQYRTGDFAGAIESARTSLARKTAGYGVAYNEYVLALAHWKLGQKEEARAAFRRATEAQGKQAMSDLEVLRSEALELGIDK